MYDSSGHGSQCGRHVVHSSGVSKAIVRAIAAAAPDKTSLGRRESPAAHKSSPQLAPMSIMEMPMVLRISTRNRSLHGAQPQEIRYSCARNSSPKPKISAPRRMVVRAICEAARSFCRSLSTTSANEMPARNKNNGAGSVTPNCDHMKKVLLLAPYPSKELYQCLCKLRQQA